MDKIEEGIWASESLHVKVRKFVFKEMQKVVEIDL